MAESKDSVVLLFTSPQSSDRIRYGLELARRSSAQGKKVAIALMQDSVFLALKGSSLLEGLGSAPEIAVLGEHLARRGYSGEPLRSNVKLIGYDGLAELLMRDRTSVMGSF